MGNCVLPVRPVMAIVLAVGFVFGVFYNALVGWLEAHGHDRGYTAFLVVGGCLVTLIGGSLVAGVEMGLWFTACFAATGLPMVIGSWARSSQARKAEETQVFELAKEMLEDGETSDGLRDQPGGYPGDQCE